MRVIPIIITRTLPVYKTNHIVTTTDCFLRNRNHLFQFVFRRCLRDFRTDINPQIRNYIDLEGIAFIAYVSVTSSSPIRFKHIITT